MITRRMSTYAAALNAGAMLLLAGQTGAAGVVRPYAGDEMPGMAAPLPGIGRAPLPAITVRPMPPVEPALAKPVADPIPAAPKTLLPPPHLQTTPAVPAASAATPTRQPAAMQPDAAPPTAGQPAIAAPVPTSSTISASPAPVSILPPTSPIETGAQAPRQQQSAAGAGKPRHNSAARLQHAARGPTVPGYCRRYHCTVNPDGSLSFARESRDPRLAAPRSPADVVAIGGASSPQDRSSASPEPPVAPDIRGPAGQPVAGEPMAREPMAGEPTAGIAAPADLEAIVVEAIAAHRGDAAPESGGGRMAALPESGPQRRVSGAPLALIPASSGPASSAPAAAPTTAGSGPGVTSPSTAGMTTFLAFAPTSAAPSRAGIAEIVAAAGEHPGASLMISGYGTIPQLAENRAVAVRDSLIEAGLPRNRLVLTATGTEAEGVVIRIDPRRPVQDSRPRQARSEQARSTRRSA
ncbi:MAG: hypothetical protein ACT60Q_00415 [Ferrovibrionaceae bacterium]